MPHLELSNMDDYAAHERRAFRAGWLAGIRAEPRTTPARETEAMNARWMQGFDEGVRLRQTWKNRNENSE